MFGWHGNRIETYGNEWESWDQFPHRIHLSHSSRIRDSWFVNSLEFVDFYKFKKITNICKYLLTESKSNVEAQKIVDFIKEARFYKQL